MVTSRKNYRDITNLMFKYATPKSNNITHAKKFIDSSGEVFIVDGKRNGTFFDVNSKDYKDSKECAQLLRKTFGGKIKLQPVVKSKGGVQTCDLAWQRPSKKNYEKWDLKIVNGSSKRTIDRMIKDKKKQSDNFIIDIKNHSLSTQQAKSQIIHIFNDPHRQWVNMIMLKDKNKILIIYKKMRHHPTKVG